ncbi:hypothetical protein CHS0354_038104 [Potamilus streckersoni]|uniref:Uncharacterized protein n=1 Tax=Potamilus streckersoni TaxID=2493646 RepID=A0AAE0SKI7_9BIVA|nr:hypothetical protein CHS0354_038104 [Potamilus streckersoni]
MSTLHSTSLKVSVMNENNIQVTNKSYDNFGNRFENEPDSQYFEHQTVESKKVNFITLGIGDEYQNSIDTAKSVISPYDFSRNFQYGPNLRVGVSQSNLAQHNDIRKNILDGYIPICNPLKVDGTVSLKPSKEDCIHNGNRECQKVDSKWVLADEETPHNIVQNDIPEFTITKKCDREAIVDVTANKHNHWNREIHDCLWCPCIFYFVFICCMPALLLMHKSDVEFRKGRDSTARYYAMCSSIFYAIGLVLWLGCCAMMITWVVVFAI